MRALFVNDTGRETNPRCRVVSATLRRMLTAAGYEVSTLPLDYWAPEYRALDGMHRKALAYEGSRFPAWLEGAEPVDAEAREGLRAELLASDAPLRELLAESDLVLINGEGSIHHNLPRALGLLALAASAASFGVRTHLVNATVQAMPPALLGRVLPLLALVHVREQHSFELAERFAPRELRLSVDVAFAAEYAAPGCTGGREGAAGAPEESCLLTSGVGAHPRYLALQVETVRAAGWEPAYLLIGDGSEQEVADRVCGRSPGERAHDLAAEAALFVRLLNSIKCPLTVTPEVAAIARRTGVALRPDAAVARIGGGGP